MTFLNRHRSRIRPVGPFAPSSLFFGGIPGAWYDPTDLSTMFQDSAGTTPVTAVEQPVGLILDKSQGLALSNGTRAVNLLPAYSQDVSQATWTKSNATTPNATTIVDDATVNFHFIQSQTITLTAGVSHTLRLRLQAGTLGFGGAHFFDGTARGCSINLTTGALGTPYGGASASAVADGAGWILTITCTPTANGVVAIYCSNTNALALYLGSGQSITATNIDFRRTADVGVAPSPYQLITSSWAATNPGNHASQSTAASRPTYRARYNLLTYSEDFGNAAWTTGYGVTKSTNTTVAPDGTTTADTITATAGSASHYTSQTPGGIDPPGGVAYTASVYLKQGTAQYASFGIVDDGSGTAWAAAIIDLSTGTLNTYSGANMSNVSATIAGVSGGWWRVTVTATPAAAASNIGIRGGPFNAATATPGNYFSISWAATGTEAIFVWGAQLLTAADVTATGNAYQRIAAATVYDTAPIFRPYLAFDGVDDSLSTAAINFTATDKMTVFIGVNKQSDAVALIAEISPTVNTNAGSFGIGVNTGPNYFSALNGNALAFYTETTFTAPATNVVTTSFDIAGAAIANEIFPRVNAAIPTLAATGANAGTGNFGTWPLYIASRAGSGVRLTGRIYSLIVRGAASSTTEIADTELWVNARTGGY